MVVSSPVIPQSLVSKVYLSSVCVCACLCISVVSISRFLPVLACQNNLPSRFAVRLWSGLFCSVVLFSEWSRLWNNNCLHKIKMCVTFLLFEIHMGRFSFSLWVKCLQNAAFFTWPSGVGVSLLIAFCLFFVFILASQTLSTLSRLCLYICECVSFVCILMYTCMFAHTHSVFSWHAAVCGSFMMPATAW